MDELEGLWTQAQLARAKWAVIDVAYHRLPQQHRHYLRSQWERLTNDKDAAIKAYQDAMREPEVLEPDPYDSCDFCGDAVLRAVLVDAGPEFGAAVSGCHICPTCVQTERTRMMERDEMPASYVDECER